MTLINAFLRPEAAYVLTDSLVTNSEHPGQAQKILPITHLNACLCVRGSALVLSQLWHVMWTLRESFADAANRLGDDYRQCIEVLVSHGLPADARGEAFLIGWDNEAGAPEIWIAANYDQSARPAYVSARSNGVLMDTTTCSDRIKALAADAIRPADEGAPFDPRRDGPELIAAQAAVPGSMGGGLCHLTTIFPSRIEMEILPAPHRVVSSA